MSMAVGGKGGAIADINVTPMIDVLTGALDHFHGHHTSDATWP